LLKRHVWILAAALLVLGLAGCKKGGDSTTGPTDSMLETKAKMMEQYAGKKGPTGGMESGPGGMKGKMGQTGGPTGSAGAGE